MAIKTIFLDRDGVINKEVNYLHKIKDFEFIDGVFDACIYFQSLGYEIIIITNQAGIAREIFNEEDYQALTSWMLKQFHLNSIKILDIFYCPHGPNSSCECRKPKPGMFLEANKIHQINFGESWMIGDKETDIQAAHKAGIEKTILVKSGHPIDKNNSKAMFIIDSIKEAIKIIN